MSSGFETRGAREEIQGSRRRRSGCPPAKPRSTIGSRYCQARPRDVVR